MWEKKKIYEIRVKAKDIHGAESEWSDPLKVTMPKNKGLHKDPLFIRFLDSYPMFNKLFRL